MFHVMFHVTTLYYTFIILWHCANCTAQNALRHSGVLEIGTYWGTSCLRVAHALDVPVTTLELDPVHVAIARVLRLDIS